MRPDLTRLVKAKPEIIWKLKPFEEQIKATWEYDPKHRIRSKDGEKAAAEEEQEQKSYLNTIKSKAGSLLRRAGSIRGNGSVKKSNRASVQ